MTGKEDVEVESDEILRQVYERTGGRTSYLAKVSRADDMLGAFFDDHPAGVRWLIGRGGREYDRDGEGVAIVKVGDRLLVVTEADEKDWPDSRNGRRCHVSCPHFARTCGLTTQG
jgi:hypothetical protein